MNLLDAPFLWFLSIYFCFYKVTVSFLNSFIASFSVFLNFLFMIFCNDKSWKKESNPKRFFDPVLNDETRKGSVVRKTIIFVRHGESTVSCIQWEGVRGTQFYMIIPPVTITSLLTLPIWFHYGTMLWSQYQLLKWNDTLNKGHHRSAMYFALWFIPNLVKALLYEFYMLVLGIYDRYCYRFTSYSRPQ